MTTPTAEQINFMRAVVGTGDNILLQACAGSGKTTTLVMAADAIRANIKILALAFNKKNAEDLQKRMPSHVECRTFHSLGYKAWLNQLGKKFCKTDTKKSSRILSDLGGHENFVEVLRLVSLAKNYGYMPPQCAPHYMKESINLELLCDDFDLPFSSSIKEMVDLVLKESIREAFNAIIDFDDMLYMPIAYAAPFEKFSLVFVDEAQDLSNLQFKIVTRVANRVIAAGDRNQAIYAFRGARCDSMTLFQENFQCKEMPLTVSWRCPKVVVAQAARLTPLITAAPNAEQGQFLELELPSLISGIHKEHIILGRTNRQLVSVGFYLLSHGKRPKLSGVSFSKRVFYFAEKSCNFTTNDSANTCWQRLREYKTNNRVLKKREEAYIDLIEGALDGNETSTWGQIKGKLEALFNDTSGTINLSTIHKAKGLEWPVVWLIDPHHMPHPRATSEQDIQQEHNLLYVAITRAQKTLIYLNTGR